jgi:hypothetical protein
MIRIGGVTHSEKEAKQQDRKKGDHGLRFNGS